MQYVGDALQYLLAAIHFRAVSVSYWFQTRPHAAISVCCSTRTSTGYKKWCAKWVGMV